MSKRRGSAFIYTLAVVVGLVAMLAGMATSQRAEIRRIARQGQAARNEVLLQAGFDRALAELSVLETPSPSLLNDLWAEFGQNGSEEFVVGRGKFRVQILDASSKLNLNTITEDHLQRLPLTAEQIDSLLDWREEERTPRPQGAKDEYYNQLETPYNAALQRFESVDELALVRGFTPLRIYEPQEDVQSSIQLITGDIDQQPSLYDLFITDSGGPNLNDQGEQKTNANEGNLQLPGVPPQVVQAIVAARPITGYGQMLRVPGVNLDIARTILDTLSPTGEARDEGTINLNTAGEAVLNSIPGMTPDLTQAILSRQNAGIATLSELADLPGMDVNILADIADRSRVATDTFIVRVIANSGGVLAIQEALVRIENTLPKILKRWTPPFRDAEVRWLWDAAGAETVLVEPNS